MHIDHWVVQSVFDMESPPTLWGKVGADFGKTLKLRITPTYVGKAGRRSE